MKITIEIDGKTLELVDKPAAVPEHLTAEPPPELIAAARRLGAESAGVAAFSAPAGAALPVEAMGMASDRVLADVDAGQAAAAGTTKPRPSKATGAEAVKRRR